MDQHKYRVMHKDTGKVKEVTKGWLDIAKQASFWKDYEMIGPVDFQPSVTIEEIPTIIIPPNPNKIQRESIGVSVVDNNVLPADNEEKATKPKAKKGRKPKQK